MITMHPINLRRIIAVSIPLTMVAWFAIAAASVHSQAPADPWSPPVNISHSGFASNPAAVRDSNGIVHVIWQDRFAGSMYARMVNDQWSQPIQLPLPFDEATPRLISGLRGSIFAFWIDRDGSLAYTRMTASGNILTWDKPQFLAEAALAFDVALDQEGVLHLAYVRPADTPDFPPGVYYRQSLDGGSSWTFGELLYPSLYFRGMDKKEANVSVASAGTGQQKRVYVAWDNRPRKRIFLSLSSNGGRDWNKPTEIQGPDASLEYASPFGVKVGAAGDQVLLLWQTGDPAVGCRQSYQTSADRGEHWGAVRLMFGSVEGCPQENHIFSTQEGLLFLMTRIQDQWYLSAWNGSQWSQPQFQATATGFKDPETQEMVLFACQYPVFAADNRLWVVGCDQGVGGDIWITARPMGNLDTWFPPTPVWSAPSAFYVSPAEVATPSIVADQAGRFHTFWVSDEAQGAAPGAVVPKKVLFHSVDDAGKWTPPISVISSPGGDVDQPALAIDSLDRLWVVWREKQTGDIYYSWASSAHANSVSEWSAPQLLPGVHELASSPFILPGTDGALSILYAVPINENRGIYLIKSADGGETWSQPIPIVAASAGEWQVIDQPQASLTAGGQIHVIWKVFDLVGELTPRGLFYAQSQDVGNSWSQPVPLASGAVYWSAIAASETQTINLVWQEKGSNGFVARQQASLDGGISWERASTLYENDSSPALVSLAGGEALAPNLLLAAPDAIGRLMLHQWKWDGSHWLDETGLELDDRSGAQLDSLTAALSSSGKLAVIYTQPEIDEVTRKTNYPVYSTEREIMASLQVSTTPASLSTSTIPPIASATPTLVETASPAITPTLTPALPPPVPDRSQRDLILGVGMIVIVIAVAIGLALRIILRSKTEEDIDS